MYSNLADIGGHRFFSKSDIVLKWWQEILPIQGSQSKDEIVKNIQYQNNGPIAGIKK